MTGALQRLAGATAGLLAALALACGLPAAPAPEPAPPHHVAGEGALRAGAGVADITPERNVWMGGYGFLRRSRGVRDPLSARALVLEAGGVRLALVALDVVGLQAGDRRRLDPALRALGLDPRQVLVHATHDHAGPDTIGLWGLPPFFTGRSEAVSARLEAGVREALRAALATLRPAELAAGEMEIEPAGVMRNLRHPERLDRALGLLHVREAQAGPTIATLTVLGVHPEVLPSSNRRISADFPGVTRARLEAALGGVALHASGALGGLVSPDARPGADPDTELERIGRHVAEAALELAARLEGYRGRIELAAWQQPLAIPVRNWRYRLVQRTGIVRRERLPGDRFESEVSLWQLGAVRLAAVPGEITPDLGMRIKRAIGGAPPLLIGLANDELGYLLPEDEFADDVFEYERTVSPGPDAGSRVVSALEALALRAGREGAGAASTRSR